MAIDGQPDEPAKKEVGGKTYVAEEPPTGPAGPDPADHDAAPPRQQAPAITPDETGAPSRP